MKKIALITLIIFLSGCLKREPLSERDHTRTDSALVVIERLMSEPSPKEELKKFKEEHERSNLYKLEREKQVLEKVEMFQEKQVDTLFLEKTITMIYTKNSVDGSTEMILDSVSIQFDTCFHLSKFGTKNP